MWILGNPIKIENAEYCKERAIYVCNHASPIDIFLIMWLTPTGTVGIAKKEVFAYVHTLSLSYLYVFLNIYDSWRLSESVSLFVFNQIIFYPLFGQLYVLANHLRINRSNPTAAIESMKKVWQWQWQEYVYVFLLGSLFSWLTGRRLCNRLPVQWLRTIYL